MDNVENQSLKQRLANHGYQVRRVLSEDGLFRGVAIHAPSGERAHEKLMATYEYGLELAQRLEQQHTAPRA